MHLSCKAVLYACLSPLLLSACSNLRDTMPGTTPSITVTTQPPGATALVDGATIGTTPVRIVPADTFRSGFTAGGDGLLSYRYMGKLVLQHAGCKEHVVEVDNSVLARDIHAELECDPANRAPAPDMNENPPPPAHGNDTAAQRLRRIDGLHEQGLISDAEYRSLRQRVLDSL